MPINPLEPNPELSPLAKLRESDMMERSRQRWLLCQKFADALVAECPDAKHKYENLFRMMRHV